MERNSILITGGSGFVGSHFIDFILDNTDYDVINIDAGTYASLEGSIDRDSKRYRFIDGSINDRRLVFAVLSKFNIDYLVNFAGESHVDRSIANPEPFVNTNILGVYELLEACRWWSRINPRFKLHHVSTDEVYGSVLEDEGAFTESSQYRPNTPYAATKAAGDHLVRAWSVTYGLNATITNSSNNYGPRQNVEKLLPLVITKALAGEPITVHGDGTQVRDWIHVYDNVTAIYAAMVNGVSGEHYNIGAHNETKNIDMIKMICNMLDERVPKQSGSYFDQIIYVDDRPGNDKTYSSDNAKLCNDLGWSPAINLADGVSQTVDWYLSK